MDPAAIVLWSLAAFAAILAVLGLRTWGTLREGREFQDRLAGLSADELHLFLASPRGSLPTHPADVLYRLNALMEFERREDPRLLPLYIELLADPHPSIVAICRETLEERTGERFRDPENETLPDVGAWRAWWGDR